MYPLRDFHDICRVRMDLLEGLRSYMGLKLRVLGSPTFSAPPTGETMRRTPKVLEVQERARGPLPPAKFGGVWISPAAGRPKTPAPSA